MKAVRSLAALLFAIGLESVPAAPVIFRPISDNVWKCIDPETTAAAQAGMEDKTPHGPEFYEDLIAAGSCVQIYKSDRLKITRFVTAKIAGRATPFACMDTRLPDGSPQTSCVLRNHLRPER